MSIQICGYTFEGPYMSTADLQNQPGVYVILDKHTDDGWYVIDVGESNEIKNRVESHDRANCWQRNRKGVLGVAVKYTLGWTSQQRRNLESQIREAYSPVCGDR